MIFPAGFGFSFAAATAVFILTTQYSSADGGGG
jgi:hypothetical protein